MSECASGLGCGGLEAYVCIACYHTACATVAALRRTVAAQSAKMEIYGADLRRRVVVLETELSQARQEIAYLRGQ